jgi:LuxR family transcriptional regulator, maltose regulon positive regulatory protein
VTIGSAEVVMATKLFAPTPRQQPVSRRRLQAVLSIGLSLPLTVVVAPAGWGKTALVADWLRREQINAGWLSLDRSDNDIKRFWRYFLVAATRTGDDLGLSALRRLDVADSDIERDVLPAFVNEVFTLSRDCVLVLEDYHVLGNPAVHESIAALLDQSPAQLHMVILTRSDPPLRLSRLRVAGDMIEVRADQLRFTEDEAVELLNERLTLGLSRRDVHRLVVRTEGWAAGLQLAALRLVGRSDPSEFIDRFTGADRHVVDYLGAEVLDSQPAPVLEFLLQTSVLNRVCAPLGNAVTGKDDAASILDDIYRADLFLSPLDDQHRWFRYHHLFRGILRHELARTSPQLVTVLNRRAAQWYALAGDYVEAVGHAIEAQDVQLTATIVSDGWRQHFNAGQLDTVQAWLAALPADMVAGDPGLSVAQVWLALDQGRLDDAGSALTAAEASTVSDTHLRILRALHTFKIGDVGGAAQLLAKIARPTNDPFIATVHSLIRGNSLLWIGELAEARELLSEAAANAQRDGNQLARIYARGGLALVAVESGDLDEAEGIIRETDLEVEQTLTGTHFVATFPALAAARLAAARAEWDLAAQCARTAVERARRGAGRVEVAGALLTVAMVTRSAGAPSDDLNQTDGWLAQARMALRLCPDPGPIVLAWLATEERARRAGHHEPSAREPLTEREQALLRLLPGPMSQRELASALFVTPNTIKTHLRAIYRKLGAESRAEAVIRARDVGML